MLTCPLRQKIDKNILSYVKETYASHRDEEIPKTQFLLPDITKNYLNLKTPHHETNPEVYYATHMSGYSNVCFSTYPVIKGVKFGKPIADCTTANIFENFGVFCIADGCGMGKNPAASAHVACEKFAEYVIFKIGKKKTLDKAMDVIVEAIAYAQTFILQTQEESIEAGLTTFLGTVILRTGTSFAVLYADVGDCRGLLINPSKNSIEELVTNYKGRVDVKSTGGRLGPVNGEYPDLENFKCGVQFCPIGTTIVLMSDGIADNFDIKTFCKKPTLCGLDGEEWLDENEEHWNKRRAVFYDNLLSLYQENSLEKLCDNLYHFIVEKTRKVRENKILKISTDDGGKMDHSTFACYKLDDNLFSSKVISKKELEIPEGMK
ncbi:hypothetical protein EIN_391610 [Entamoeba invadens IP1]|uniref:PPM-type phosphatase domain-containing protein n=1 Tax=Entamoeba invadens IP1 TaxID=370355 RepID=A0A0A1UBC4_ENTIV|nr:hypothetical protein EIN_391610 [Entamoeba invadens IP1]ELP89506.1 hypothetical protein EIN_391610 [Entamoeba invadens IP1]|eukprot:XP_004256277.1 hypothetical protein EIN_391610 [Entamoeba invadens IP1]